MEEIDKLRILSGCMGIEPAEEVSTRPGQARILSEIITYPAQIGNGKTIRLLKSLLSSACERNCAYCTFRCGHDIQRASFSPDGFAALFMRLQRAGICEGLFLSSGIAGGCVRTQDQLLKTADILRNRHQFQGYLHLKLMPGAEYAQVEQAMQLADRVSINLEAPNPGRLKNLAPLKKFDEELIQPLKWVEEIRTTQPGSRGWHGRWPSSTTQFVMGGADESDLELLSTTAFLYERLHLRRAYFSAFKPVPGTPLEDHPAASLERQFHLYQASYLLRDYGFTLEELPFNQSGSLPESQDPKLAWAEENLKHHPVELYTACREELLRIPGFGPKSVDAWLVKRNAVRIHDPGQLQKLGIQAKRASPYILINGQAPIKQLALF